MSLDGKQADGPPDVKWSPLLIDICNTRGLANALPSQRLKLEMSHVPVITPHPYPSNRNTATLLCGRNKYGGSTLPNELLNKELYY